MVLSRLTKITGPGVATDTNWVGNNADFTGITTTATSFNIGVTTIHSNLIEAHNIKSTGIITATGGSFSGNVTAVDGTFSGNVSIAGTLTYEDVTNIDSVGIITAPALDVDDFLDVGSNIKLGNAGVITATSFVGSGAALTGIDATAIKDSGGNVKVQAQASGAVYTGIHTFSSGAEVGSNIKLGNAGVVTATSFTGSGANLTSLPAGQLTGTVADARISTLTASKLSGALPAISGANLTNLDASDLASGTVPTARLGSGTANSSTFLRGDSTFAAVTSTTINSNADNRIITGSGTANTLNAESGLTFSSYLNLSNGNADTNFGDNSAPGAIHGFFTNNSQSTNGVFSALSLAPNNSSGTNQSGSFIVKSVSGGYTPEIHIGSRTGGNTTESNFKITSSRSVEIRYQGNTKLATTSSGVHVLGTLEGDNLKASNPGNNALLIQNPSNGIIGFGANNQSNQVVITAAGDLLIPNDSGKMSFGASEDLQIYHNGTHSFLDNSTGSLFIRGATVKIRNLAGTEDYIEATENGAVSLYFNNSKKFQTITNGASMGQGTQTLLWPYNGTSQSRSFGFNGEDGSYGKFELRCSNGADTTLDEVAIRVYANAEVQLLHNNVTKFYTTSTGTVTNGNCMPDANNSRDLGSSSVRWRNLYTNDLNLSNEGSTNSIDNTWGDWTIQEGESDVYMINNRSGKKFKIKMEEVL